MGTLDAYLEQAVACRCPLVTPRHGVPADHSLHLKTSSTPNPMTPLLSRWSSQPYRFRLGILVLFFLVMAASFYQGAMAGPDMRVFLIVVVACFLVITLFLARHVFMGLLLMGVAGGLGWLADIWGVTNGYWTYHGTQYSFLVLHPEAAAGGVPVEIVLAYFFSAMWMTQVLESLFDEEHDWMHTFHASGKKLALSGGAVRIGVSISVAAGFVIAVDPLFLQPLVLVVLGVWMTLLLPAPVRNTAVAFGLIMGTAGLFFEMLCTGKLIPDLAIWTYAGDGHDSLPWLIGVLLGYAGAGAIIASAQLVLLKHRFLGKQVELLPHPAWI